MGRGGTQSSEGKVFQSPSEPVALGGAGSLKAGLGMISQLGGAAWLLCFAPKCRTAELANSKWPGGDAGCADVVSDSTQQHSGEEGWEFGRDG